MYNMLNVNIPIVQQTIQNDKENYIVNMLVSTLYSNKVDKDECYRIIEKFKEKILSE